MAQATTGDTVRVHYTGRLEDGSTFDSSAGREPLEFTLGAHQVIAGFENGVTGMETGETKTVTIPPEQAYGPQRADMIAVFEREKFPPEMPLTVGEQLHLRTQDGHPVAVTVTEVTDSQVTLDANHPLAGKTLIFDLELTEIV